MAKASDSISEAAALANPRRLVVLVPGFNGRASLWDSLRQRLESEANYGPRDAHWLIFDHNLKRLSVGTLDNLAIELQARIDAEWAGATRYEEIVLVGHSTGGLIARQVYLRAVGAVQGQDRSDWGERVTRIVLMASINRGVDLKSRRDLRPLAWAARVFRFLPHFTFEDILRGSDFLTNMRIDWIRHFTALADREPPGERSIHSTPEQGPLVVQLLGTKDDLVKRDDSRDVFAFPNGHYLTVPDSTHKDLYRLDIGTDPGRRYTVLRRAFVEDFSRGSDRPSVIEGHSVSRVVFLLHGIRASNVEDWIANLDQAIKAQSASGTVVIEPTYGYLSAARFTLPTIRRRYIPVFKDWYIDAIVKYPNAKLDIIAHSNGTYILGNSLVTSPGMRFVNVVLVGCVLPVDFRWGDLIQKQQVSRVRNDRANRDWPVALLCNALNGLGMRDVGTAGFAGFNGHDSYEVAFYPGGHGKALGPTYSSHLVDFISGQPPSKPETLQSSPGYFRPLSNAMPYLSKAVAMIVLGFLAWLLVLGQIVPIIIIVAIFLLTLFILEIL